MVRITTKSEAAGSSNSMREIAELNAKINLLLAMNSLSKAEFLRRSEECTNLNAEMIRREEERVQLNQLLVQRNEQVALLNGERTHCLESLIQANSELVRLNKMLTQREQELVRGSDELARLNKTLTQREQELVRGSDELARVRGHLLHCREQSALLNEEVARKGEALTKNESETLELSKKLTTELNSLSVSLMLRSEELAQAIRDLDNLKRNNEALRSSTSWRLTAPLRALVNFLRRQYERDKK